MKPNHKRINALRSEARRFSMEANRLNVEASRCTDLDEMMALHDRSSHFAIKSLACIALLQDAIGLEYEVTP